MYTIYQAQNYNAQPKKCEKVGNFKGVRAHFGRKMNGKKKCSKKWIMENKWVLVEIWGQNLMGVFGHGIISGFVGPRPCALSFRCQKCEIVGMGRRSKDV